MSATAAPLPSRPALLDRALVFAFLEHVPDLVYFKDRQSRYVALSQSLVRHLGASTKHQVIGRTDFDFFTAAHAQRSHDADQRIMRTGQSLTGVFENETPRRGPERWLVWNKVPLRNAAGEVIGTFAVGKDVTSTKEMEAALDAAHRELVDASRTAGMTEMANGVLHNVGNVLNSLNVSASVIAEGLRASRTDSLGKLAALLTVPDAERRAFLQHDARGKRIPEFLASLARHTVEERDRLLGEIKALQQNIDHVKEIVAMQQNYAMTAGVVENLAPADLMADALRITAPREIWAGIEVQKEFAAVPAIRAEKAKVLQILVNLIRNAKYACDEGGARPKRITLSIRSAAPDRVQLCVSDNGVGIPPENLTRIFGHGFTTRKNGHGFGLHSAANAAREMKGSLTAASDGQGCGATFILELPAAAQTS